MSLPEIVDRPTWLAARRALLDEEKALTRARDAVNTARRRLPMVRVDKDYRFVGEGGAAGLADLFAGRRQLIVYHFMFAPEWETPCSACSAFADERSAGELEHLARRDTTFVMVARAPYERLARLRAARGWATTWFSSHGSDFNYDFGVTIDESAGSTTYNYRTAAEHEAAGSGGYLAGARPVEEHGLSCFLADGGAVYHTYSAYARGTDLFGAYAFLDLTALGRQEAWEEPKGRSGRAAQPIPNFAA